MAYREMRVSATERLLVVRPQRAITPAVFLAFGGAGLGCAVYAALFAIRRGGWGDLWPFLLLALFSSFVAVVALHGWLLRVEFRAFDDGTLTMAWTRWPFARRIRTLQLAAVTDVIVETDDGTSKIVVVAGSGKIPLTGTATSDALDGKVKQLREFLRLH